MKQNMLQKPGNGIWLSLLCVNVLAALLLSSLVASPASPAVAFDRTTQQKIDPKVRQETNTVAPPPAWTAVGSTGTVDEAALNFYAFDETKLGFKPNTNGLIIVARYNVTNTFDNNSNPGRPGWHELRMWSKAPSNTTVTARLFVLKPCVPGQSPLCTVTNTNSPGECKSCAFNPGSIDFGFEGHLYYVEVKMDRTGAPNEMPCLHSLRIY